MRCYAAPIPTSSANFQTISKGACGASNYITGTNLIRNVAVTVNNAQQITFVVTVYWMDGANQRQATLTQVLRERQQ